MIDHSYLEAVQIFAGMVEGQLSIPQDCLLVQIASHHPAVNHVFELKSSCFVCSKFILQDLNQLSTLFDVGHIVSSRIEEGRCLHLLGELSFVAAHQDFADNRGMEAHNRDETVELSCQSEGLPDSPAEANCEVLLVALLLEHVDQINERVSHLRLVQALGIGHDGLHIGWISSIDLGEDFRQVDVVAPVGVGVSDGLVATCESAKYVSENDEDSISRANMISLDSFKVEDLTMWMVLDFQGRPGTWWAAAMFVFCHQSQNIYIRSNCISRQIIAIAIKFYIF